MAIAITFFGFVNDLGRFVTHILLLWIDFTTAFLRLAKK